MCAVFHIWACVPSLLDVFVRLEMAAEVPDQYSVQILIVGDPRPRR